LLKVLKRIKYLRDVKKLNVPGIKEALGSALPVNKPIIPARPTPDLGDKLRRLRKKKGLTVTEAARQAHISAGFLSAIELSRANPSVATIYRLAAAYGTTVLELYDLPAQSNRVIKPRNRKSLETKSGVRMELLSTGTKMLESMLIRVPPGTGSDGTYMHQGEDFLYMLAGSLEIWLDEVECQVLQQGDSFWFESNRGHRWFNATNKISMVLWVNTPPTF
jgi:transcriptional regulator with XRE-family HTH domain